MRFANPELPEDNVTVVVFRDAKIAVSFFEKLRVTGPENPLDVRVILE